ncbi:MAG: hypothetical protein KJO55_07440 [Gammaproteobacteria bacterium]|nr:hypothetical protein [Gammaproteobacteria bacterium]NND59642.1 hypothetical protein [Gammaproteobacteria bacterium]
MADVTKKIGLSLGADICWPICYEHIMRDLDLNIAYKGDQVRFQVERVSIEPYSLQQECSYHLVIDRLTHWFHTSREWIKKSILLDDLYVFNHPWALQSMEKQTTYTAMMRLGMPVPETWMLPPKNYEPSPDLEPTLRQYARLFDLESIGARVGYPCFIKPYDGGGWAGVRKIDNAEQLREAYDASGKSVMMLQKGVLPHDYFVRCIGLGPQLRVVNYKPEKPLHDRYGLEQDFLSAEDESVLADMTYTINAFFGWDFNSCEALLQDGAWIPIDFANACPDSQVTSLHYHFPWLIKANIRWSVFCATVGRRKSANLDFRPYFDIAADGDRPWRERLRAYGEQARKDFQADEFEEFCDKHLGHLDEVADHFFSTDEARDAVHKKVVALYPEHEHEQFTELFWQRIQKYRQEAR